MGGRVRIPSHVHQDHLLLHFLMINSHRSRAFGYCPLSESYCRPHLWKRCGWPEFALQKGYIPSWWLSHPFAKICLSNWIIFPGIRVNMHIWNDNLKYPFWSCFGTLEFPMGLRISPHPQSPKAIMRVSSLWGLPCRYRTNHHHHHHLIDSVDGRNPKANHRLDV